jgi:hypothetical protein
VLLRTDDVTQLLPILLLVAFGALAFWLWRRKTLDERLVRIVAAVAGSVLLYDAITEPSRRYVGLLFVLLAVLAIVRPGILLRRAGT